MNDFSIGDIVQYTQVNTLNLTWGRYYKVIGYIKYETYSLISIENDNGDICEYDSRKFILVNKTQSENFIGTITTPVLAEKSNKELKINKIKEQMAILKNYLQMNVDRDDYHSVWDVAIDLARLSDKIELLKENN